MDQIPDDCVLDPDRTNPLVRIIKRVITAFKWGAGHQLILKSWGKNPAYPNVHILETGRASKHPNALAKFFARGG
jgi:hypothetical protein